IKFDLYNNSGEGPNSTGIFTDGRSPTVRTPGLPAEFPDRSVDLRGTGIELQSQSVKRVELTYDGSKLTETITDEEDPSLTFTTSYAVDIQASSVPIRPMWALPAQPDPPGRSRTSSPGNSRS